MFVSSRYSWSLLYAFMKVSVVIESNYKENRFARFWDITQRILVNTYRHFGTTYR